MGSREWWGLHIDARTKWNGKQTRMRSDSSLQGTLNYIPDLLTDGNPHLPKEKRGKRFKSSRYDATVPTTSAANPSSSVLTVILVVTPLFAEKAILTRAATLPPDTDLPYNFNVCVLVDIATSVPSSGCRERARGSCSVASDQNISGFTRK